MTPWEARGVVGLARGRRKVAGDGAVSQRKMADEGSDRAGVVASGLSLE
jgi:hypothetical protein